MKQIKRLIIASFLLLLVIAFVPKYSFANDSVNSEAAPNGEESVAAEENTSAKVTFHFDYGDKKNQDDIRTFNKGDVIGDNYPKQEAFECDLRPEEQVSAKLELVGFYKDGKFISLEEMAKEVVDKDVKYTAAYNVLANYNLVAMDGREESLHMTADKVSAKLSKEFGVVDTKSGNKYFVEWTLVSSEEQDSQSGEPSKISRFQWKGETKFPLNDENGKLIKYEWNNFGYILPAPFKASSSSGNPYGGVDSSFLYITNYYPWVIVYVSDASEANPVEVKVKVSQQYPSDYSKKVLNETKTFTVNATKLNDDDGYGFVALSDDGANVTREGDRLSWDSYGRIYTASKEFAPPLKDGNAYGKVVLKAEAQELEGYTLLKYKNDFLTGVYDNDGDSLGFMFRYHKKLQITFDASAAGTTIKGSNNDKEVIGALQKIKFNPSLVPSVNEKKDETFIGWIDKDDASKTVIDFSNYHFDKDTVLIPLFKEYDTKNIDPIEPKKTEVVDLTKLTDDEKDKVKKEVEKANKDNFPEGTKIVVADDGAVTVTYPDGSTDTIDKDKTVVQKVNTNTGNDKDDNKDKGNTGERNKNDGGNSNSSSPKTGEAYPVHGLILMLLLSGLALVRIRKVNC